MTWCPLRAEGQLVFAAAPDDKEQITSLRMQWGRQLTFGGFDSALLECFTCREYGVAVPRVCKSVASRSTLALSQISNIYLDGVIH
mmetsp:Transcript_10120/g.21968  ORF Transcript_10120/g.21968 Transcript_10120/m.21968 type:complete len:86 (+) Transcript_10120:403-660(+)|eukprot:6204912-Pleurochrysis_carterae.AAC.2